MICSAFLEMLSVSLILPFMKAAMEPDEVLRNKYVSWICKLLSIDSGKKFLIFIAIVLACVYVLKNIFMIYQTTVQCEFVYNNMYLTQKKLLNRYFSQRYDFFLGAKSGEIFASFNAVTNYVRIGCFFCTGNYNFHYFSPNNGRDDRYSCSSSVHYRQSYKAYNEQGGSRV